MLETFFEMISLDFIGRAVLVGLLVSVCASLLGTSLVMKRYSMIGDGLSHVAYGAMAIAAAANVSPLYISIPVVIIASFLLLRLSRNSKIKGDALIAVISSAALAIGMIIVSLSSISIDLNSYMFGSILALSNDDVILSVVSSVIVLGLYILFYHKIFAVTFDESFSKATGVKVSFYNTIIAILTAVLIVVGMRLMGALLISSLIIFPSLSSMRVCKSYRAVTITSVSISVISFLVGIIATFYIDIPTGASIVVTNAICFVICLVIGAFKNANAKK